MTEQIKVIDGYDKLQGTQWTDFPDCPEPYRSMLKDLTTKPLTAATDGAEEV
jgi:hypothetical protein